MVREWGGKSFIISDVPIDFELHSSRISTKSKSIAVVASFMFDEPIEEIFESARINPSVNYYVTGNYKKAPKKTIEHTPENVYLQGFMKRSDYIYLLLSTDAVMALTTRDFTMQRGAYEALSLERPIITSDWDILKESFGAAAVYTDNTAQSIKECVRKLFNDHPKYLEAAQVQRKKRRREFEIVVATIKKELRSIIPK